MLCTGLRELADVNFYVNKGLLLLLLLATQRRRQLPVH